VSARRRDRLRQAGFTLVELMVVLTILGLLATAVTVYMRPQRSAIDCANVVADVIREGARRAVSRGPVLPAVVTNLGVSQRTQITISGDYIRLSELVESVTPGAANWVQIKLVRVVQPDRQVTMTGWKTAAQVNDGASGNAPAIDTTAANFVINCWPDGRCDAGTLYFAGPNGSSARTVVLPLGGATLVRKGM
jgi:prepilin-type N-terminal cleavage/methylation domain-containing protein